MDPAHLTHAVYIAGVKFRDLKSSDAYKKITGVAPYRTTYSTTTALKKLQRQ
ncbi:MAG: hypothetical protein QXZ17_12330 [Nitrososphaerota archaeon]